MFYLVFRVLPTSQNEYTNEVEGALASCWVCADDAASATTLAAFKVRQLQWQIERLEEPPIVVADDLYTENEFGLERYQSAQEQGISIAFAAWSRDGKTSDGPIHLRSSNDFDLSDYLSQIASLKRKGRCLHYGAGIRCNALIDAHSIQRSAALSPIAQKGHVYVVSKKFSDTKRNKGSVAIAKQGINKVSTFRGFCGKHDTELFQPIDTVPLAPNPEQVTLYAYRSLCRELFVKENTVTLFEECLRGQKTNDANQLIFDAMLKGSRSALKNLTAHKSRYDAVLKSKSFSDIKSCLFHSADAPTVVFSGCLYPDYDFFGNQLQDLTDSPVELDLITFSFAPMAQGWAFLLAWLDGSSQSCVPFVKSLTVRAYEDASLEDLLFRFVVSNCENLALSPTWWDSLSEEDRTEIARSANYMANPFSRLQRDYLALGLKNSGWRFDKQISHFQLNDQG